MKRAIVAVFILVLPAMASAGWVQGTVNAFYVTPDSLRVSVTGASTGTCSFWGYEFNINKTNANYEDVFAVVVAAHISKVNTTVWFIDSTAVGTTQTTGCTESTMAQITSLGMADL